MGKRIEIIIGTVYRRLTILREVEPVLYKRNEGFIEKRRHIECLCECGAKIKIPLNLFRAGGWQSCGCYQKELTSKAKRRLIHGKSHSLIYGVWHNMVARCTHTKNKSYYKYGGRGVKVCDEWVDNFLAFNDWAMSNGYKKGLELDKDIKGDGLLYSPEMCYFATRKENNENRRDVKRVLFEGKVFQCKELAAYLGVVRPTIYDRINKGKLVTI